MMQTIFKVRASCHVIGTNVPPRPSASTLELFLSVTTTQGHDKPTISSRPLRSCLVRSQMLQGSSRACPVTGPHWEQIGFQGSDPRTDVNRSMKMFAVLQVEWTKGRLWVCLLRGVSSGSLAAFALC